MKTYIVTKSVGGKIVREEIQARNFAAAFKAASEALGVLISVTSKTSLK